MTFSYLAGQTIRREWRDFVAYVLASSFSVMVFFVFVSLYYHPQFNELSSGSMRLQTLFTISAVLVALFSALFLWYSSALFFRRRHREVGTYLLLGMKAREAASILYLESLFVGIVALGIGIAAGLLLRRLFLLILVRAIAVPIELGLQIDMMPIVVTAVTFLALFAIGGLSAALGVLRFRLVRLFSNEQRGEERPRHAAPKALLAVVAIVLGYSLAAMPRDSVNITTMLSIMVITIVGTFLLFAGGSYVLLRIGKRRATKRMSATSIVSFGQLLFRIRKNAKFLALIAVMNAVTIAAVGTFLTLREEQSRMTSIVPVLSPFDFSFFAESSEQVRALTQEVQLLDPEQNPASRYVRMLLPNEPLPYSSFAAIDALLSHDDYQALLQFQGAIPSGELGEDAVLVVARVGVPRDGAVGSTVMGLPDGVAMTIAGHATVRLLADAHVAELFPGARATQGYIGVVSDELFAELLRTWPHGQETGEAGHVSLGVISVDDPIDSWSQFEALRRALPESAQLVSYVGEFAAANGITGILLFIGGFIGVMLILSNGSIIFFRQIMEAQESRNRFRLLRRLGYTQRMMRRSILESTAFLFGVPYAVGLLHAFFALLMLTRLIDIPTLGAHLTISVFYAALYAAYLLVTARTYEKTVTRGLTQLESDERCN